MKISIIIPIYNAERTLSKCINSLLKQTFLNFEILLINDGSTDNSLNICNEYLVKDKRVKVISQLNKGVSAARNKGVDEASGDYLCFVDADDWVEESYLDIFARKQMLYSEDILVLQSFYFDSGQTLYVKKWNEEFYDDSNIAQCFLENNLFIYGAPWNKLFLLKLVKENKIRFPEDLSLGEDSLFFMNYLMYIKGIYLTSECAYHYMEAFSFLSKKKHTPENLFSYYLNFYNYVEKQMFSKILNSDNRYSGFYSSQIQGITTAILNMFYHRYGNKYRHSFLYKIYQNYYNKFPNFVGLTFFEKMKIKCLLTRQIWLIDMMFYCLFIFRKVTFKY